MTSLPSGKSSSVSRRNRLSTESGYRIGRKLGEGGMGAVFEAEHLELGRRVAIKFLHADLCARDHSVERFRREARALAGLHSEHVVAVTDFGQTEDGVPFFVMEYLEGQDLRRVLEDSPMLSPSRAAELILAACNGLEAAHAAGLIHRDLKPENLFLVRRPGDIECVKVLDFGVAKAQAATTFTREGTLVGSARYMAPEQIRGDKELDARVDVFALGSILYECLAGEAAFKGDSNDAILFNILHTDPPHLSAVNPHVPASLANLVHRAIARERDERLSSISEMRWLLQELLGRVAMGHGGSHNLLSAPPADAGAILTTADESVSHVSIEADATAPEEPTLPAKGVRTPLLVAFAAAVSLLVGYWWGNPMADRSQVNAESAAPEPTSPSPTAERPSQPLADAPSTAGASAEAHNEPGTPPGAAQPAPVVQQQDGAT